MGLCIVSHYRNTDLRTASGLPFRPIAFRRSAAAGAFHAASGSVSDIARTQNFASRTRSSVTEVQPPNSTRSVCLPHISNDGSPPQGSSSDTNVHRSDLGASRRVVEFSAGPTTRSFVTFTAAVYAAAVANCQSCEFRCSASRSAINFSLLSGRFRHFRSL